MKTDKLIHGAIVRKALGKGLWDVMETRGGRVTGAIMFTGTMAEVRAALKLAKRMTKA